MDDDIRREIEDECGALADRAKRNDDKALEATLLVVRAMSSMPSERRGDILGKYAIIGGIFLDNVK